MNEEKFKPIPLGKLIDSLNLQFQVGSIAGLKSPDELKRLASTLYWLEKLKELKRGSKRNGKVSKRAKGQGDGDSSGSKGEG